MRERLEIVYIGEICISAGAIYILMATWHL